MKKIVLSVSIVFLITTNVFAAGSSSSGSSEKKTNYDKAVLLVKSAKNMKKMERLRKQKKFMQKRKSF